MSDLDKTRLSGSEEVTEPDTVVLTDFTPVTFSEEDEAPIFVAGDLINSRYTVQSSLGRGGMGQVFQVSDRLHPEREVALKVLMGWAFSDHQLAMFKNEFATMTQLSHPNLAAVYDFAALQDSDKHFFTMEYVAGTSIGVAAKEADWELLIGLLVQVCRALAYMHSRKIIHFDLKPSNVQITPDNNAKLLDFGLAGTQTPDMGALIFGTPSYMAPERATQGTSVDHRTDIYSLGIMAYRLFAGRVPFAAKTPLGLQRKHLEEPLSFEEKAWELLPAWIRPIIERLCAKEASDRFRTANEVIEAINRAGGLTFDIETEQTRDSYILFARYVGQRGVYERVVDFVDSRTSSGDRHAPSCFVAGPSGIGKSRLLKEVRHHVQLGRGHFIEAHCYEGMLSEFGPVIEALRHAVALANMQDTGLAESYASVLATLDAELAPAAPTVASQNAEAERMQLINQIGDFLIDVAKQVSYVLYFDDLQWAHAGTIDLLINLLRSLSLREQSGEPIPLAVIGSYRDNEVDGRPLERLLDSVRQRGELDVVPLSALGSGEVSQLLGSMLGIERPPEAFVARVFEQTGGNPFFVEEVMRTLVENGFVYLEQGQWAASEKIDELPIPASIKSVFLHRASLLDPSTRELLDLLAVRGQPVEPELLDEVLGQGSEKLHHHLAELMRRQMVVQVAGEPTRYGVRHDGMRQSLCGAIDAPRQASLHRRLGEAFESSGDAARKLHLYDLAYHFWSAREKDKALTYCAEGADQAYHAYANDLGLELYEHVLELMPDDDADAERRLEIIERIGLLAFRAGRYPLALERYGSALASIDEPLRRARLLRKMGDVHYETGDLADALDTFWNASDVLGRPRPRTRFSFAVALGKGLLSHLVLRLLPWFFKARSEQKRTERTEISVIYDRIGTTYYFVDPTKTVLYAVLAYNAILPVGECNQLAAAVGKLGVLYCSLGLSETGLKTGRKALAIAERLGVPWYVGQAQLHLGIGLFFNARLDETMAALDAAKKIFLECGGAFELGAVYTHLSYCHLFHGDFELALQSNQEGVEITERSGSELMGKAVLIHLGLTRAKLGETENVRQQMLRAVRMCEASDDKMQLPSFKIFMGDMFLTINDIDRAIEYLEHAVMLRETYGIIQDYTAGVYALLARAYIEKLRAQPVLTEIHLRLATKLSRKGLRLARRRHPNYLSPSLLSFGLCKWTAGKRKRAKALFAGAIAVAEQQRTHMWLSEALFCAGRFLVQDSADERDLALGQGYLQRAIEILEETACLPYLHRARAALEEHTSQPQSS